MLTHKTEGDPMSQEDMLRGCLEGESPKECYERMMERFTGTKRAYPATMEGVGQAINDEVNARVYATLVSGYTPPDRRKVKKAWYETLDHNTQCGLHDLMRLYGCNDIIEMFDQWDPEAATRCKQRLAKLELFSLWESYKNA